MVGCDVNKQECAGGAYQDSWRSSKMRYRRWRKCRWWRWRCRRRRWKRCRWWLSGNRAGGDAGKWCYLCVQGISQTACAHNADAKPASNATTSWFWNSDSVASTLPYQLRNIQFCRILVNYLEVHLWKNIQLHRISLSCILGVAFGRVKKLSVLASGCHHAAGPNRTFFYWEFGHKRVCTLDRTQSLF